MILLTSFTHLLLNPWLYWQYLHNMAASVVTASFVISGLGAFYLLTDRQPIYGRIFVRTGVIAGVIAKSMLICPTGDAQGKMVAEHQPVTLAAMEGLFETAKGAPILARSSAPAEMSNRIFIVPSARPSCTR
jgi:cytochrome bd ubiquinol oxidase subunit I